MNVTDLVEASRFSYRQLTIERWIRDVLFQSNSLDFNMQAQTQSNWCWAATATSVSLFYRPTSAWTQCKVANAELGFSDCCNSPVPSACNVPWYLDKALTRTDNFVSIMGPVGFSQVRAEIIAGRVVGARIGWSGGGGHFMVIHGCSTVAGTQYFDIDDPIYGKSQPTVSTFSDSYQGSGSWTHSYYTTRPAIMIKIKPFLLTERIVLPIWQARTLLTLKHEELARVTRPEDLSLALPHRTYNLGLDVLKRSPQMPDDPSGLRVIEMEGDHAAAMFDLDIGGAEPQLLSMAGRGPGLGEFERALAEAVKYADRDKAEAELRLLRVPALYVDAVWVHYDKADKDFVVPVRAPGITQPLVVHKAKEFLKLLSKAASARTDLDDDLKGA